MEIPTEIKSDIHRLLLGPLNLGNQIFGALIPGCIFTAVLLLKGRWAATVLTYPYLGYKTKLGCGILGAYAIGRASLSIVTLLAELVEKLSSKKARSSPPEPTGQQQSALQALMMWISSHLQESAPWFKTFIGGFVAGPLMFGRTRAYEFWAASKTDVLFHLSTGLLLIVAAFIPGHEGRLRLVEAGVGAIFLVRGVVSARDSETEVAGMMGMMLGDLVSGMQPGQLSKGLKVVADVVVALSKTPYPSSDVTQDEEPKIASEEKKDTPCPPPQFSGSQGNNEVGAPRE